MAPRSTQIVPSNSRPKNIDEEDAQERAALQGAKFKLKDAIAIAEKAVPDGKAIDAEIDTENGIPIYVIEIDKNGVQTVDVDLETGNVLRVKDADADDAGDADEALDPEDSDENADE